MMHGPRLNRRTVLKGLGTTLALPWLEAMLPGLATAAAGSAAPPLRMAFLYVPNGAHMPDWTPETEGSEYATPWIHEPLEQFRDDYCVLSGLAQQRANANGDGGGDHARALATFLTGMQARKTHGADIKIGVSVDQVAAQHIGRATRFPSLEIGCDQGPQSGNCDSGYSCAYSANISWKTESTPVGKEINPKLVFERLFTVGGNPDETAEVRAKRDRYNKSILDFVLDDAQRLKQRLGIADQRKMDEYLTAVRELELRIARTDSIGANDDLPAFNKPAGIPKDYGEHIRLMCDLLVLAFQGDVTRISTFVFANEGSNRSYPFLEVPEGHHDLSHHGRDPKKQEKIRVINRFHVTQFAYLLEKLKAAKEGNGSLLDNCMIVYGSGIGDGNRHNHDNLPIILAGRGGGTIKSGRHIKYDKGLPLTNLYLAMLDRVGAKTDKLGDSSGRLEGLSG